MDSTAKSAHRNSKSAHGKSKRARRTGTRRWLTRRRLMVAAFALPSLIVTAIAMPRIIHSDISPDELISQAGYMAINPPSRFHGPGTLNTVEGWGGDSLRLHPTCELDMSASQMVPAVSDTVDQSIKEQLSRSFDVSSNLMGRLDSEALAEKVKSVNVTFKNMRILLMSHERLLKLQQTILSGSCEQAILYNIEAGAKVCQTEAVLQADMVYTIEYVDNLSSSHQAELTKEIASKVKIEGSRQRANEVTGKALYYGIKLMPRCIELQKAERPAAT